MEWSRIEMNISLNKQISICMAQSDAQWLYNLSKIGVHNIKILSSSVPPNQHPDFEYSLCWCNYKVEADWEGNQAHAILTFSFSLVRSMIIFPLISWLNKLWFPHRKNRKIWDIFLFPTDRARIQLRCCRDYQRKYIEGWWED